MSRTVVVASILTLLFSPLAEAAPKEKPDLSGYWELNVELSENPQEQVQGMMENRRRRSNVSAGGAAGSPGGGGGGGGAARGGGGGGALGAGGGAGATRGGFSSSSGGVRSLAGLLGVVSQGIQTLKIDHRAPEIQIEDSNGNVRSIFTDGRLIEREGEDGGKTKVKTKWKKDRVIVKVTFPTSGGVTPGIELSYEIDDLGRLVVTSVVSASGPGRPAAPLSVERVYDRRES
jgi:hypothetical protein